MDAVLGLSVTPSAVGLVLVEGQDADGATMDGNAFEVGVRGRCSALQTSEQAAAAVLRSEAIAATHGHRLHSIGVTWSDDANAEASLLLKSLSDSGFDNVVAVRLPEATEALARGIAEVIGYGTTAVCVLEPETVIVLIVHLRDGSVQTSVNRRIITEEDLVRWMSTLFTRADWQPEALVMVGSGGDDELMPILERALSVPVFAPAEAQLALARGAAMASAQNAESTFGDTAHHFEQHQPEERRRRPLGQAGPLALLIAGVLTFTVSASVAVSLQLVPKKETASSEPQPAAKVSPEPPAVVTQMQAPLPVAPPAVVAPPAAVTPVDAPPPPVYSEPPVGLPDVPPAATGAGSPGEGLPSDPAAAPPPADGAPLPPEQLPPPAAPVPAEHPGIIGRIRDRLHRGDEVPPPPEAPPAAEPAPAPPAEPVQPAPASDAPPVLPPG
ncbi:hypothetical protein Mycsm_03398 [Mycobacterium sp. JS623]|uniref:DUF7159 family protein n=1 Tax=Mycobacterium sp. JS623 TaxID=212767 RepID=UPI0002A55CD4|nr:hypothetical protein [Mycobacterium sp. JS623]AGB23698.1 hypothetical protein Mycsm_03398 [Mycobacterium sp. JS623]